MYINNPTKLAYHIQFLIKKTYSFKAIYNLMFKFINILMGLHFIISEF